MLCIILNIFSMGFAYDGMTERYESVMRYINLVFTSIFIIECILKMIALGHQYFLISWNNFDFSIVLASIFDIVLDVMGQDFTSFLSVGP